MLRQLVEQHGTKAWAKIASIMRTKGSKQCRWVGAFSLTGRARLSAGGLAVRKHPVQHSAGIDALVADCVCKMCVR